MLTIQLYSLDEEKLLVGELQLEHSLVSLSKWESQHEKPFHGKDPIEGQAFIDYIDAMIVGGDYPKNYIDYFTQEDVSKVNAYINSKQTATWFPETQQPKGPQETITAELIYYWLITFNIPFSCETWHFNKLMTLIRVCGAKQTKPKKMSKAEWAEQQRKLNAQRREAAGTTG